ncbi:MAG: hypothetical protein LC541_18730 [Candidatus Thiodiazotropha sp.]|nr:hypothetical protein [Candidatus Thiodiazotropha sp.]MCM8885304.1 hypothetical protein [Candidatus Thiodiazotropha sp.]MCM8921567.1 hypothetical protein [Candidatus Thiodiazotropha sp.]
MVKKHTAAIRLRMPQKMKNEFDRLAEEQGATSSAMMRSLASTAIDAWEQSGEGRRRFYVRCDNEDGGEVRDVFEVRESRWGE